MKLGGFYELAVKRGIEADPRGAGEVQGLLAREQKKYAELTEKERRNFDEERLSNPYSDTRILSGDREAEVKSILAGIDIEVGEILLADRLRERGLSIDLVLAHHPEGKALAALHDVMHLQEDVLAGLGVPINVAEGMMAGRIGEVQRGLSPLNHNRTVDAAQLLNIPLMCVHTPVDNLVTRFLTEIMDKRKPYLLGDVVDLLEELPEYAHAARISAGPQIVAGSKERRAGKIFVDMTGGTSGAEEVYAKLAEAGVGTMLVMHVTDKHRKEAEKTHINVIIAGHMASDALGMNLLLDGAEAMGVTVYSCSGLDRIKRMPEA